MSNKAHNLAEEFPQFKETIHELKVNDTHFKHLFDKYEELDNEIYNAEQNIKPMSDEHLEELKKKRIKLKDELYATLVAA